MTVDNACDVEKSLAVLTAPMPEGDREEEQTLVRVRLPTSVRDRFKAYCALRGHTMSSFLANYIYSCLEKGDPDPRRGS